MTRRVFNFSAGPATMPAEALEAAREALIDFRGQGMSILEMSHRGPAYLDAHAEAVGLVRELLKVPASHDILLLQGGATLQFAMVPLNLLSERATADYVNTGHWAGKAMADARRVGAVREAWSDAKNGHCRAPSPGEISWDPDAAYVHITTNETAQGVQWRALPDPGPAILAADMSSDILTRPVEIPQFGLIYAGAQKNLGPAGVTLVILRKALLSRCRRDLPAYLSYQTHCEAGSHYNTPNVFGVYLMMLTLSWIKAQGGVAEMASRAEKRARIVYRAVDDSEGYYHCPRMRDSRSRVNVCFRLPTEELEARFVDEARAAELESLKGHRSVGGIRASMYAAMPVEGAERLAQFMEDFRRRRPYCRAKGSGKNSPSSATEGGASV